MRAQTWAALLIAAIALPGCADNTFQGELSQGSVTGPGSSLTLRLTSDSVSVGTGGVVTLGASLSNGADPSTLGSVVWQSSNPSVATVSNQGQIKGIAAGSTTVSVSAGSASASAKVTVQAGDTASGTPTTGAGGTANVAMPELPRDSVSIAMPAAAGSVVQVKAGDDLQAAINAAQPGDQLVLQVGATFTGSYTLPAKSGSGWIVIRSSGSLPAPGVRVTPAMAGQMPKLVSQYPSDPVVRTELGAHHYRLIGLEITTAAGQTSAGDLVRLGSGGSDQNTTATIAHDLVLDRVYVHGGTTVNVHRCVGLNSAATAIVDSWVSDCHGKDMESQAIAGWNGPGPYRIENNHIEGSGMGLMFGGATAAIYGLDPADIVIRHNHFTRPLSWQGVWQVKNQIELKHARRVLIEGNVIENNWQDAQSGNILVWKSSADLTGAEWTLTSDITFRYNVVRNSAGGLNLAAAPDGPAQPARRVLLQDNRFENIGKFAGTGDGRMFTLLGALQDVQFVHNTVIMSATGGAGLIVWDGDPMHNFRFRDNIATLGTDGIVGSGIGRGTVALSHYTGDTYDVAGNVFIGTVDPTTYPAGNQIIPTMDAVGFVNAAGGNSHDLTGPFRNAGADETKLRQATAGAVVPPHAEADTRNSSP